MYKQIHKFSRKLTYSTNNYLKCTSVKYDLAETINKAIRQCNG